MSKKTIPPKRPVPTAAGMADYVAAARRDTPRDMSLLTCELSDAEQARINEIKGSLTGSKRTDFESAVTELSQIMEPYVLPRSIKKHSPALFARISDRIARAVISPVPIKDDKARKAEEERARGLGQEIVWIYKQHGDFCYIANVKNLLSDDDQERFQDVMDKIFAPSPPQTQAHGAVNGTANGLVEALGKIRGLERHKADLITLLHTVYPPRGDEIDDHDQCVAVATSILDVAKAYKGVDTESIRRDFGLHA